MFALLLVVAQLQPIYACEGPTHTTACHLADKPEDKRALENLDVRILSETTANPSGSSWGMSARAPQVVFDLL